jgi:hypothetical protein
MISVASRTLNVPNILFSALRNEKKAIRKQSNTIETIRPKAARGLCTTRNHRSVHGAALAMYSLERAERAREFNIEELRAGVRRRYAMLTTYTGELLGGIGSDLDVTTFFILYAVSLHVPAFDAHLGTAVAHQIASSTAERRAMQAESKAKHSGWLEAEKLLYIQRVGRLHEAQKALAVRRFVLKGDWRVTRSIPFERLLLLLRRGAQGTSATPSHSFRYYDSESRELKCVPDTYRPPAAIHLVKGAFQWATDQHPFAQDQWLLPGLSVDHALLLASFESLCYRSNIDVVTRKMYPEVTNGTVYRHTVVGPRLWPLAFASTTTTTTTTATAAATAITRAPPTNDHLKPPCIQLLEEHLEHRHLTHHERTLHASYYAQWMQDVPGSVAHVTQQWRPASQRDYGPSGFVREFAAVAAEARALAENTLVHRKCQHGCRYAQEHKLCYWLTAHATQGEVLMRLTTAGVERGAALACASHTQDPQKFPSQRCGLWANALRRSSSHGPRREHIRIMYPVDFTTAVLPSTVEVQLAASQSRVHGVADLVAMQQ